jgi:hypothetical protein
MHEVVGNTATEVVGNILEQIDIGNDFLNGT